MNAHENAPSSAVDRRCLLRFKRCHLCVFSVRLVDDNEIKKWKEQAETMRRSKHSCTWEKSFRNAHKIFGVCGVWRTNASDADLRNPTVSPPRIRITLFVGFLHCNWVKAIGLFVTQPSVVDMAPFKVYPRVAFVVNRSDLLPLYAPDGMPFSGGWCNELWAYHWWLMGDVQKSRCRECGGREFDQIMREAAKPIKTWRQTLSANATFIGRSCRHRLPLYPGSRCSARRALSVRRLQ